MQAVGGAAAVCAALELLSERMHPSHRAVAAWAAAGGLGAAAGPAIGGALTEAISWEAIFFVQVPLALAALAFVPRSGPPPAPRPAGRPAVRANLALALLSAALTAALFLVVLLLINGWGHSPFQAALIVSVMPAAAMVAYRVVPRGQQSLYRASAGAILIAGGLAALALLPAAAWALAGRAADRDRGRLRAVAGRADRGRAWPAASRSRSTAAGRSPPATPASVSACWC